MKPKYIENIPEEKENTINQKLKMKDIELKRLWISIRL